MEYYRMTVEEDPSHVMAWGNMAAIHFDRRQFQESLHCHRQALAVQPETDELRQSCARLLAAMGAQSKAEGNTEEALRLYHEALSQHPAVSHTSRSCSGVRESVKCVEAMYNLGVALAENGEKEKAIFMYETAIHHNNRLPEVHNNLGVLHKDMGRDQKAIQCYQNALAIQPDFAMVPLFERRISKRRVVAPRV